MAYNPQIHHRKSIRLQDYDYSQAGLYFITICVQDRLCLFGDIRQGWEAGQTQGQTHRSAEGQTHRSAEGQTHRSARTHVMVLNDAGKMVEKWYFELPNKFPDIKCHEMVVMPNHFHCILENTGSTVGADLCVCPSVKGQTHRSAPTPVMERGHVILGEHAGSPLHRVVQWFKTMTTNEYIRGVKQYGWPLFQGKLWQRNYWEHIIRSERSYLTIATYIQSNPDRWRNDQLYQ
jgi:putative transposase